MLCHLVANHPSWGLLETQQATFPAVALFDGDRDLDQIYWALLSAEDAERMLLDARRVVAEWRGQPEGYLASVREWNTTPRPRNAGLQLALRCHTYNGVWRNSGRTGLNVPPNTRLDGRRMPSELNVADWVKLFENSDAHIGHWNVSEYVGLSNDCPMIHALNSMKQEQLHAEADAEVVVYLDPPYVGKFVGYLPGGFTAADQVRTLQFARDLSEAGYFVAWSNANCAPARELLRQHWPEARVETITVQRTVAADKLARIEASELLALSS